MNNLNIIQNLQEHRCEIVFTCMGIFFAWVFSVMMNNMEDQKIDQISNPLRPLISKKININAYKRISWLVLFMALVGAYMASFIVFIGISVFIGAYFLYSMPPIKFKKVFFLSKLIIAFNSLVLVMLGYSLIGGHINGFPSNIYPLFLIGFTAVINFIDIKDYEGDKKEGIKTLPVVFGLNKSKIIIGAFFFLSYIGVYWVLRDAMLAPLLIVFGALQCYLIIRKNYRENPVFITYLLSALMTGYIYFTA